MKNLTFAKAGTAALALAFILVMAGCLEEPEPEPGVEPTVSRVTVNPETISVQKGGTQQFTAELDGTELDGDPAYKAVTWSIVESGKKPGTVITETGSLTVAADETLTSLTIKAVSALDSDKNDTATVNITEAQSQVSVAELPNYINNLSENTSSSPHTVKVATTNITISGVMDSINHGVANRYVILDLSDCFTTDHTISGNDDPGPNDMNVIQDNQYIVGIVLPRELTTIGKKAFSGCGSLISVTIPEGVVSIRESAFEGCYNLASVTIPGNVASIGDYAFSGCEKLTSVTIPNNVVSIGDYVFEECYALASVTIPNKINSIGDYAFSGCSNLCFTVTGTGIYRTLDNGKMLVKDGNELAAYPSARGVVALPSNITKIGNNAFSGCEVLTSIIIPNSVASIGSDAFSGCISITSITIPGSVDSIGSGAFSGCSSLASVAIPDSVDSIGSGAFSGCNKLASVTIPDRVTSIGSSAFSGCSSLTSVTIPSSVTSIGGGAFSGCSKLEEVEFLTSDIAASNFPADAFPGGNTDDGTTLQAQYISTGAGTYTFADDAWSTS